MFYTSTHTYSTQQTNSLFIHTLDNKQKESNVKYILSEKNSQSAIEVHHHTLYDEVAL